MLRTLPTVSAQNGEDRNQTIYFRGNGKPQNLENALAHVVLDVADDGLFRTPSPTDSTGGAISEKQARDRGRMMKVADQAVTLAFENGLPVSESVANSLLPTPTIVDMGNNKTLEEWEEWKNEQRLKHGNGNGHGASLSIEALAMLPTPNTMEHREIKTPEQIAELKERSPGGYRNLRETVVNELITLPTPTARDFKDGSAERTRDGLVQTDSITRAVISSGEVSLLGTPRTSSANGSTAKERANGALKGRLEDQVAGDQVKLFPTLRASDSYERRNQKTMDRIAKDGGDMTMTTLARTTTDWGKYEPAIRRWEAILGRQSPDPTNPDGRDGAHRLSSRFTEWMMGLPEGWITSHGLSREKELKLAGNGVVPQQAALALAKLMEGINLND